MSDFFFESKSFFNGVSAAIGAAIIAIGYKIVSFSSKKAVPYVVKKGTEDILEIVKEKIVTPEIKILQEMIGQLTKTLEELRKEVHSVVSDKNASNMAVHHLEEKFKKTDKKMDIILEKMEQENTMQNDFINEIRKRLK